MRTTPRSRLIGVALVCTALVATGAGGAAAVTPPASGSVAPSCAPGSGPNLAGKHVDAAALAGIRSLACADLTGADLSGLDLTQRDLSGAVATHADLAGAHLGQADLTGANLSGATLTGADLTQATLTGADLSGALASGADFTQAHAENARFTGADLSHATFIQATLTGAVFDAATIAHADVTQADLDGASFAGAQGLIPWSRYLLFLAVLVFLLVGWGAVRRAWRRRAVFDPSASLTTTQPAMIGPSSWSAGQPGYPGYSAPAAVGGFHPINARAPRTAGRGLAVGLLAAALIAFGVHLVVGALLGQFSFAYDTLATVTCTAASCPVGINGGMLGLFGGFVVLFGGFWALSKA